MKKTITILLLIVSFALIGQNKSVVKKLQITKLKNAEVLKTDSKGNIMAGELPERKTTEEICKEKILFTNNDSLELMYGVENILVENNSAVFSGKTGLSIINLLTDDSKAKFTNLEEYRLYITTNIPITISHLDYIDHTPITVSNPTTYPAGEIDITDYFIENYSLRMMNASEIVKQSNFNCYLVIDEAISTSNITNIVLSKKENYTTSICDRIQTVNDILSEKIDNVKNIFNRGGELVVNENEKLGSYSYRFIDTKNVDLFGIGTPREDLTDSDFYDFFKKPVKTGFFMYPKNPHQAAVGFGYNMQEANGKLLTVGDYGLLYRDRSMNLNEYILDISKSSGFIFKGFDEINQLSTVEFYCKDGLFQVNDKLKSKNLEVTKIADLNILITKPQTFAPNNPQKGMIYFDRSDNVLKCWNGTMWKNLF